MNWLLCAQVKAALAVLCVAFSVNACSQKQRDFSGDTIFKVYRESQTDIITMKVPNGYLDGYVMYGPPVHGARESNGPIEDKLYFEAALPDLAPRSNANNWKFEFPASLTEKMRFNFSVIHTQGSKRIDVIQKILFSPSVPDGCAYEPNEERHKLEASRVDFGKCSNHRQMHVVQDYFFKRDSVGGYSTVMECSPENVPAGVSPVSIGGINPMCQHRFYDSKLNAIVTMHYPRPLLGNWAELEQTSKTILHSFIVTP